MTVAAFERDLAALVERHQDIPPLLKASLLRDQVEQLEGGNDPLTAADLVAIGRRQAEGRTAREGPAAVTPIRRAAILTAKAAEGRAKALVDALAGLITDLETDRRG